MAAAALAIGASYGGAAAATAVGLTAGTLAYSAVAGAVAIGIMGIGSSVLGLKPDQPKFDASAQGILANKQASDAFIPVIYGSRRVGGTIVFLEQDGDDNQCLHLIIVLSEGEIDSVGNIYFNDVEISDLNLYQNGRYMYEIDSSKTGTDSQTYIDIGLTNWTAAHRLRGTAYIHAKLEWNAKAYPQGLPTLTADVKGVKVYDPRTSTTAWSDNPALCVRDFLTNSRYGRGIPADSIDDTTFMAAANYCDNLVTHPSSAVAADVFMTAGSWYYEDINSVGNIYTTTSTDNIRVNEYVTISGFANSANNGTFKVMGSGEGVNGDGEPTGVYNVTLTRDDGGSFVAEGTEGGGEVSITMTPKLRRYTCNGVVDTEQGSIDILNKLLTSCRGMLIFSGGKYKLIIDKPETSSFAFTEDNITGAWSITLGNKSNQVNRVRASFYNANRQWQSDIAVVDSSTFRTADNGLLLEREIELPFTSDIYTAQEIVTINLNQARQQLSCQFNATIEGLRCEVGDVVTITHSTPAWTAKEFRIMTMRILNNDEVAITAVEYDATVYNFTLNEADATPNTNLPNPSIVAAPTNFAWTQDAFYENAFGRLTWTAPADVFVDKYILTVEADAYVSGSKTPAQIASVNRELDIHGTMHSITDLPAGDYTATLTAVNVRGVSSTSQTVQFNVPTPPMPNKVTGLELDLGQDGQGNGTEWTGKDCKIKWQPAAYYTTTEIDEAEEGADTGSVDWYHKDYEIKVYNGSTLLRTEYVTDTWYIYSYEKNAEDAGKNSTTPYRELTFEVRARGRQNQVSEIPAIL